MNYLLLKDSHWKNEGGAQDVQYHIQVVAFAQFSESNKVTAQIHGFKVCNITYLRIIFHRSQLLLTFLYFNHKKIKGKICIHVTTLFNFYVRLVLYSCLTLDLIRILLICHYSGLMIMQNDYKVMENVREIQNFTIIDRLVHILISEPEKRFQSQCPT